VATILLTRVSDMGRYGWACADAEGRLLRFEEKGDSDGVGWIDAGVYLLSRSLLGAIPEGRFVSLEQGLFPAWLGRRPYGYRSEGAFLDIGTPESYAAAAEFFAGRH